MPSFSREPHEGCALVTRVSHALRYVAEIVHVRLWLLLLLLLLILLRIRRLLCLLLALLEHLLLRTAVFKHGLQTSLLLLLLWCHTIQA